MNNNITKSAKPLDYFYSTKSDSEKMQIQGHVLPSNLSCKSQESLDSGIFSRQKSCESVDSIGQNCSIRTMHSVETDFSSADEVIPPLPIHHYEDYLRECQDIQQSIIIRNKEEGKTQLSRSNSMDEQDDDLVAEWLQMAGFSDLVTDPALTTPGNAIPRDSLSSMTVLLTLTKPQRAAVLRRITSFNRSHMNKKPAKPALSSVFPDLQLSVSSESENKKDVFNTTSSSNNEVVNDEQDSSPKRISREFAELTPFIRPRASSSPFKLSSSNSDTFSFSATKKKINHAGSSNSIEANVEVTVASTESLPANSSVKSSDDTLSACDSQSSRSSTLAPAQVVTSSVSMPDLNLKERYVESITKSTNSNPVVSNGISNATACLPKPSCEPKITPVKMRSNSVSSDRKTKALSDIPSFDAMSPTLLADDPARLVLEAEILAKKSLKIRRKSSKSSSSKLSGSKTSVFANKKGEVSPRSLMQQNNIPVNNSPELKKRFLLSPGLSLSVKRRSPTNSPLKAQRFSAPISPPRSPSKGQKKQSPLRKLSSMSISNLRSTPKRTGSYKIKQSSSSPRKSLRRTRSLKNRDKPQISLMTTKMAAERKKSSPLPKKAPSIESLTISTKSEDSWKSSKDNVSLLSSDESRNKGMSFSAEAANNDFFLPNFYLVRDKLGITKINDLSGVDMRKVQSLALIELTALFDLKRIELKRRKTGKTKPKEFGVFGTPLTTLVDWDKKRIGNSDENNRVPQVLSEIVYFLEESGLKTEGILRKCGSAARMKLLKQDMNTRFGTNFFSDLPPPSSTKAWSDAQPHDVATLLKQFLRELPVPLLSFEYIDAFHACTLITDLKEQLQALNLLIILLNDVHRDCLKLLLKFLSDIVANEENNKMSLHNVAMITAPNLFITARKNKKELKIAAGNQDLKVAAGTSNIVRILIYYHKLLWVVPAFMVSQVRNMNKAEQSSKKHHNPSKDKLKMKLFANTKVNKSSMRGSPFVQQISQPFDCETPKGLIRVQAPNMNLTSIAVQLTNQLTASDVIAKYRRQTERMQQCGPENNDQFANCTYALYEVGGNIHERCLDPNTNIAAILQVNPEANWFLRFKQN